MLFFPLFTFELFPFSVLFFFFGSPQGEWKDVLLCSFSHFRRERETDRQITREHEGKPDGGVWPETRKQERVPPRERERIRYPERKEKKRGRAGKRQKSCSASLPLRAGDSLCITQLIQVSSGGRFSSSFFLSGLAGGLSLSSLLPPRLAFLVSFFFSLDGQMPLPSPTSLRRRVGRLR